MNRISYETAGLVWRVFLAGLYTRRAESVAPSYSAVEESTAMTHTPAIAA